MLITRSQSKRLITCRGSWRRSALCTRCKSIPGQDTASVETSGAMQGCEHSAFSKSIWPRRVLLFELSDGMPRNGEKVKLRRSSVFSFLLWCMLFVLCWPVALLALVLYPFIWLLLLPFRVVGIAVHGALALVWAVVLLPARLLSAPFRV